MAGKQKRVSKRRGRRPGQKVAPTISGSKRAGLIFPAGRCNRKIRQGRYALRQSYGSGIFMAAILEYLTSEILDLAGNFADQHKKKTISPRHLRLAIGNDNELNKLLCNVHINEGGVIPNSNGTREILWSNLKSAKPKISPNQPSQQI